MLKRILSLFFVASLAFGQQTVKVDTATGQLLSPTTILFNGSTLDYTGATVLGLTLAGTGTVTDFTSGNLSPLFTTSVATSTTTPALTFSLSNAASHTVFGNKSGSSGAPSFLSDPAFDKISNLTSNGHITTSGGDGTLGVDTATYVPGTRTLTLAGTALDLSADRAWTLDTILGLSSNGLIRRTGANTLGVDTTTYVPATRSLTLAGTALDLSADRAWTLDTILGLSSNGLIKRNGANTLEIAVAKTDFWDNSDFIASGTGHAHGLVPDPGASAGTARFLREDTTWATPPGTGTVTSVGTSAPVSGGPITGTGTIGLMFNPTGGTTGQALIKASNTDYDFTWGAGGGGGGSAALKQDVGDANATISAGITVINLTTTLTAPRVITLPASSSYTPVDPLVIVDPKRTVNGANTISVARAGSDTINGGTSNVLVLAAADSGGSVMLFSDGAGKWSTISKGGGSRSSGINTGDNGTVTSVGLAGTANQVTVTGSTPITSSGSWTLSIPASAQLDIAKLTNLTSNGFVKTGSADGTLSIDTTTYGTVTHTGGALTSNAVVLGAGSADTKVVTGITTDGVSGLLLGNAGTNVGYIEFSNATSGTISLQPATGALGTPVLTLPAHTDTLVGKTTADILTNKTLTSPTLTTPVLGTPSSGTLTSCTGLPISTGVSGLGTGIATWLATPTEANLKSAQSGLAWLDTAQSFTADQTISGAALILSGNQSAPAWTTSGVRLKGISGTLTDTTSSGTVAAAYTNKLGGNTIAASSATTFTDYISLYTSEPVAGSNVTFTNKWAFGADSLKVGTSNPLTISSSGVLTATSPVFTTPVLGTPGSGTLTNCTGLPVSGITASTSTALGVGSIELGHATNTTLSQASAGVLQVEGVAVPTISSTSTLTNKRINPRATGSCEETSSATSTPTADSCDQWDVTALAAADAFVTPSGAPVNGQRLLIRIKDNGTARALSFDAGYRFSTDLAAPSTTVISKTMYLGFIYNSASTTWDNVAQINNF